MVLECLELKKGLPATLQSYQCSLVASIHTIEYWSQRCEVLDFGNLHSDYPEYLINLLRDLMVTSISDVKSMYSKSHNIELLELIEDKLMMLEALCTLTLLTVGKDLQALHFLFKTICQQMPVLNQWIDRLVMIDSEYY